MFFQCPGPWCTSTQRVWEHQESCGFLCFFNVLGPVARLQEGPGNMRNLKASYAFSMFWGLVYVYKKDLETWEILWLILSWWFCPKIASAAPPRGAAFGHLVGYGPVPSGNLPWASVFHGLSKPRSMRLGHAESYPYSNKDRGRFMYTAKCLFDPPPTSVKSIQGIHKYIRTEILGISGAPNCRNTRKS